jgi:hypothetical protein
MKVFGAPEKEKFSTEYLRIKLGHEDTTEF